MALDLDFVRARFPALHGDWVFMDNAGGSQTLQGVVDKIGEFLLTSDVQTGASYAVSQLASSRVWQAREVQQRLIDAERAEQIVMGSNASTLFRFLSLAMAEQFQPGDEIILTNVDHEVNISPWLDLAESRGLNIKWWQFRPETLELELDDLDALLTEKTRLVCVTLTSNVLGTINPVADIARRVHDAGALLCVDAVAYAPHRAMEVRDWDVDFCIWSAYKVYGPHHAFLYGKYGELQKLGNLYHRFVGDKLPNKLEPGNPNYELAYGCIAVGDYLEELADLCGAAGFKRPVDSAFGVIAEHEEALSARLLDYLKGRNNVRIIGRETADRMERVPTISFVVDGRDSESVVRKVDQHHIGIRFGDFYACRLIQDLGLARQKGVVRVSMVHYNTLEEVDRLIRALDEAS